MITKFRNKLYSILISSDPNDRISRFFNFAMLFLISLNILAVIFETEQTIYQKYEVFFKFFEVFSVIVFTIEYILRIWVCVGHSPDKNPFFGRIKFALKPLQIIDVLSILPFYLPFLGLDLRFIRALRLFRLFRLFKVGHYSRSLSTISNVIKGKKEELSITLFAGFILLILSSSLMYLVENKAQPDTFTSIPDAMWWGAVTLTTVGYGDIFPITPLGKILGAGIALLGIGLFALPAGIIASGFANEIQKKKAPTKVCPHCGEEISE